MPSAQPRTREQLSHNEEIHYRLTPKGSIVALGYSPEEADEILSALAKHAKRWAGDNGGGIPAIVFDRGDGDGGTWDWGSL